MVDVSGKSETKRTAKASGRISGTNEVMDALFSSSLKKGDALATARIAGIMAAKRTSDLIPLCHPLPVHAVEIDILRTSPTDISVTAEVTTTGKTGVEMEALTAISVSLLTLYDMGKAVDKRMVISDIKLEQKSGGKSGDFHRSV